MVKYKSYNKMFLKGKSMGKQYEVLTANTKKDAEKKTNSYNRKWNNLKMNKSSGFKAKLVKIKKI